MSGDKNFISFLLPVLISTLFLIFAGGSMVDATATLQAQATETAEDGDDDGTDSYYG